MTRRVSVFYYGSFINLDVLKQADVHVAPESVRVARLPGWELRIGPLASLVPNPQTACYGIVVDNTHEELEKLYAQDWVGNYLPEPVLAEVEGAFLPALTYVKWEPEDGAPDPAYVERIAGPAETLGFPAWYVTHIRSFI